MEKYLKSVNTGNLFRWYRGDLVKDFQNIFKGLFLNKNNREASMVDYFFHFSYSP